MSVETIIVGYIKEAWPGCAAGGNQEKMQQLEALNLEISQHTDRVLTALPLDDQWPPLTRSMFGWPPGDVQSQIQFRYRIIHFGACIREMQFSVRDWLDKFDSLLRQLYWEDAYFRANCAYIGPVECRWQPTEQWVSSLCKGNLTPISEWEFTTTFDDLDSLRG